MSRIYWDTMLFVYWFEDAEPFAEAVDKLLRRMTARGDHLVTSVFTLGEILIGPLKANNEVGADRVRGFMHGSSVELIPLDQRVIEKYAHIRANYAVKPPGAIHLASAAAFEVDLFLTNDGSLRRLAIDGIHFIDGLNTTALG